MSESREEAIKELKVEYLGERYKLRAAKEKAISDMEKLEKIEKFAIKETCNSCNCEECHENDLCTMYELNQILKSR